VQISFPDAGTRPAIYVLPKGRADPAGLSALAGGGVDILRDCEATTPRCGDWGRVNRKPGEIFPNTALHPRQTRTSPSGPHGAHQTEVWRWYLVRRGGAAEVKNFLRDFTSLFGARWPHRAGRHGETGIRPRRESRHDRAPPPYSYEQGMGYEVENYQ